MTAPLRFSVIVPLEFHRGQTEECLRRWASDQTLPASDYEIVAAACRSSLDDVTASRLRALLGPRARLLLFDEPHDMPLCAQAAAAARGEVLVFTESHCHPRRDLLAVADAALRARPDCAGFSGRSLRITHNRLSVVEADLYEEDIRYGMEEHPWRKILDQLFVVRAAAYRDAGGFRGELGHFAEWHLAARMHQRGHRIGYAPEIQVAHHYVGDWRELVEFSADFARGELVYHDRHGEDPCRSYFAAPHEWWSRHGWRPHLVRAAAALARGSSSTARRRPWRPAKLVRRLRLRAHWATRARFGARAVHWRSELRFRAAILLLTVAARLPAGRRLLRFALFRLVDATVRRERIRYLRDWLAGTGGAPAVEDPAPAALAWEPDDAERLPTLGFHELETWEGQRFRWSEPVGLIEAPLGPGTYRFTIRWLPIRRPENVAVYLDEEALACRSEECQVSATFTLPAARTARLSWTCEPWAPLCDRRLLGLPVVSLRCEALKTEPDGG